jgi:hypothetical protein
VEISIRANPKRSNADVESEDVKIPILFNNYEGLEESKHGE